MIYWFKRHPQHLVAESSALSNDSNYKELYQVRDNLFLSHGNIIVRLDKIYRFPILIVYPEATPYILPSIYPLKENLSKEQMALLAKGSQADVHYTILPYVEFYYHLRHQNQTGSLCILEWDNLDDGSKFYGITTILKRVRDWCGALITGNFPPDSQETEFCSHFNKVDLELKFFYPETFLDENFTEGEAYGLLFKYLPKGKYYKHDRRSFFGCLIIGKNKNGIYENLDFTLPNFFFGEGITNAIELISKKDVLKRFIDSGQLLKSFWFQIGKEPNPFLTQQELITIIGEGDYDMGLKRIMPFYSQDLKLKPDHFLISIRFPNRKGVQEFQLFRVSKKNGEASGALICAPEEEAFRHLLDSYDQVFAIQCEKFTDESFHQRNSGRAERKVLKESSVNVIGVGALGSEIADALGKAGVGTVSLFDNQVMRAANSVRHLAGLDHVGALKVEAVADIINNHNPYIHLQIFGGDINSIDLNDFFIDQSISISSIADDNTEGFLNERAVISNKIVYYARALRGGKAARIFRVIPGKDACFNCLNLYRNEGKEFINIREDKDLPTLKNECNNPIRPASAADLKLISALTSRILLDELQQEAGNNNHWIWTTEPLNSLQPYQLHAHSIKPHPGCYYCNHEKKARVILPAGIEKQMQALITENPKIETGGILAGYADENGDFIITNASGPGPNATHSATKFKKDVKYCQEFLDNLFLESKKRIVYIGEWHSHPNEKNLPSGTDIKSLTEIAFQKEYLTDMPLMIILSNEGVPSCTLHPAGKRYYFAELIIT
ncbi:MAG: hypothetical protein JWP81_2475 [Ferruginibacter sp.]|nr:hypothetical protein [Ferruginibacter sp.]